MPVNNIHKGAEEMYDPVYDAKDVSPNDSTDLPDGNCRGLYVGTGGDVEIVTVGGTTVVFHGVVGGTILPIRCSRVRAANTVASDIVALY